jgi:hypothetical protein
MQDLDHCPYCGANKLDENFSMHLWSIKYECGYQICGAIDTKTHGEGIEILELCNNKLIIQKDAY